MLQIINISEARSNLAKVIRKVKETGEPMVIVQDSNPAAILYPYHDITEKDNKSSISNSDYAKKLLSIKGDWFSLKEYKKMRKEVRDRVSKLDK